MSRTASRRALATVLLALAPLTACHDPLPTAGGQDVGELGVVLNSVDLTLTVFPVDSPYAARQDVGLAPDGSPVSLAVGGGLAVVPLGVVPAVAVVDLHLGTVVRTVALPTGSGATGVAFVSETTVLVANSSLDTTSPVDVVTGTTGPEIPVGGSPQAVVAGPGRVAVLNAELGPDFQPRSPGTVTVLDRESLEVLGIVTLSGYNPGSGALGPDGHLYVVNSGHFGQGDGSLSVVDLEALVELSHHPGFGEFPFSAGFGPRGRLHVGSFAYGVAVWEPGSGSFIRSPADPVTPEGIGGVSGLAFDGQGRLYTLRPDCQAPSVANRLESAYLVEAAIPVGTCPIALGFWSGTSLEPSPGAG